MKTKIRKEVRNELILKIHQLCVDFFMNRDEEVCDQTLLDAINALENVKNGYILISGHETTYLTHSSRIVET